MIGKLNHTDHMNLMSQESRLGIALNIDEPEHRMWKWMNMKLNKNMNMNMNMNMNIKFSSNQCGNGMKIFIT